MEFEAIAKQMMQFLERNAHPHVKIIIDSGNCELLEGLHTTQLYTYAEREKILRSITLVRKEKSRGSQRRGPQNPAGKPRGYRPPRS